MCLLHRTRAAVRALLEVEELPALGSSYLDLTPTGSKLSVLRRRAGDSQLRFVDESPDEMRARRIREGLPPAVIESALAISAYQRAGGKTVTITTTVADLTGRPPRTFTEFAHEQAAVFRGLET